MQSTARMKIDLASECVIEQTPGLTNNFLRLTDNSECNFLKTIKWKFIFFWHSRSRQNIFESL